MIRVELPALGRELSYGADGNNSIVTVDDVKYIDADGQEKTQDGVKVLSTGDASTLISGWYVIDEDIDGPLTFTGNVNLIILDNKNVTITGADGIKITNGNLTIYGQSKGTGSLKITANGKDSSSGFGVYAEKGEISINGGILTISATNYGISTYKGENSSSICDITITGGTISTQGVGVGIGCSGDRSSCGNITISDGTITAQGGEVGTCGNITISDGTITAQGGEVGIGISGDAISCGDIIITGGTITAHGGKGGIGISGDESSCGDIIITGGTITAQGDMDPGIGCYGDESSCGDISISWSENFVSLTAIKGHRVQNPIGLTNYSNCGDITFDGTIINKRIDNYVEVDNGGIYGDLKFTISTTLPEDVDETDEEAVKPYKDNTWTLTPMR